MGYAESCSLVGVVTADNAAADEGALKAVDEKLKTKRLANTSDWPIEKAISEAIGDSVGGTIGGGWYVRASLQKGSTQQ